MHLWRKFYVFFPLQVYMGIIVTFSTFKSNEIMKMHIINDRSHKYQLNLTCVEYFYFIIARGGSIFCSVCRFEEVILSR